MAREVNRRLKPHQEAYLLEVCRGLAVTAGHFLGNMIGHLLGLVGLTYRGTRTVTVQYPEQRRPLAVRYRTLHRLVVNPDGTERCVACMCCETICPADCIQIVAGEAPDRRVEKYPVRFDIDISRCVVCGLCVEACPEDAIRMDTGILETAGYDRREMVYDKACLMGLRGRYEDRGGKQEDAS